MGTTWALSRGLKRCEISGGKKSLLALSKTVKVQNKNNGQLGGYCNNLSKR